nr:MAG TPA: hypothetical protein [Caudoviricetes sp.]
MGYTLLVLLSRPLYLFVDVTKITLLSLRWFFC